MSFLAKEIEMKKRILAFILILAMCFTLFACGTKKDDQAENKITPALYKVTDNEGHVIWLFGSIHVGRENFYPLPSYVMDAFNSSDAAAFEFDLVAAENDYSAQIDMAMALMYKDGSTIKDHVSEEVYQAAVEILKENNMYSSLLDMYMPIMWSSSIDMFLTEKSGLDSNLGIDRHLLNLSKENGKEILEVESMEYQTDMMANFSGGLQELLLEVSVGAYKNYDESVSELYALVEAWGSGDEGKITAILYEEEEFESEEEKALYEEYSNALIVERNNNMTVYAENALKSGKEVFICVGAAHIVGDGAIAENLRELGYTVELINK
ncbi:MAG: TraB/GumN family protein [Ruminococcaceae bacterium]|nr:TraB/GumN family protein [Oscillospiraceae bacterium]